MWKLQSHNRGRCQKEQLIGTNYKSRFWWILNVIHKKWKFYIYILLIATFRQPRRTVTLFLLQKSKQLAMRMMVNEWYTAAMVLQGMMKRQRQHVESIDALAGWLGISVRLTKLHCKRYHRCIGRLSWYIGQADQTSLQTLSRPRVVRVEGQDELESDIKWGLAH